MPSVHWRAWRLRAELGLNAAEIAATRGRLQRHLATVGIGVASMAFAIVLPGAPALAGLVFFLMGPVHGWLGHRTGKAVELAAEKEESQ